MSDEDASRLHALGLPPPGTVLAGRYRVERLLGVGGMGAVLLARHVLLEQWVAIKLLHAGGHTDPQKVARFFNEARAAARIQGDHVVRVHDVGQLDDGRPYMCMEYLEGMDVGQWMRSSARISVPAVVATLLDASDALAQAHAMGVVHRDLKPSNLYLVDQADGTTTLKVLDFGIAKMQSEGQSAELTATGTIMGTPAYMAPEQMRSSRRTDHRADIWALGVIAFELLSRSRPFAGDSLGDILFSIAERPAVSLQTLVPEVPPGLASIVARCLEREPDQRFASIVELVAALQPFAPPGYGSKGRGRHVVAPTGARQELSASGFGSAPTAHDPGSQGSVPRLDLASVGPHSRSSSFHVERPRTSLGLVIAAAGVALVGAASVAALWVGHGRRAVAGGAAAGPEGDAIVADARAPLASSALADAGGAGGTGGTTQDERVAATTALAAADSGAAAQASRPATPATGTPAVASASAHSGPGGGARAPAARGSNPASAPPGMASDPDWSGVNAH